MTELQLAGQLPAEGEPWVRAAAVVDVDLESRTIEARLAPYEVEGVIGDGLFEVFTKGAFAAAAGNPSRVKVTDQQHNRSTVVGNAVELRDADDALYGRLRIADTAAGRDVLTLLREEILDELSVEFLPQKRHLRVMHRTDGGVLLRHDRATLIGVSPVSAGAYGSEARVLAMRDAVRDRERERAIAELAKLTAGPRGPSPLS